MLAQTVRVDDDNERLLLERYVITALDPPPND